MRPMAKLYEFHKGRHVVAVRHVAPTLYSGRPFRAGSAATQATVAFTTVVKAGHGQGLFKKPCFYKPRPSAATAAEDLSLLSGRFRALMKSLYLPSRPHLVFKCASSHLGEAGRLTDANSRRPDMTAVLRRLAPPSLNQLLRAAPAMTRPLMLDIIDQACRRFPSRGRSERSARIMRLVDAEAWADATLALIE